MCHTNGLGGEYQSLSPFFQRVGISHQVSCPHAHQQNGAAERKHRHIVEVGLTLLAHASMPLKFWDEAFLTAVFLINRLPSKVIHHDTPHERLYSQPPDYASLHTFGCACWPNLRPYNARKLEFRSKQCVFLGYSNHHKGFKCLEPSTGRVYVSRDVVFDENVFPFAKLHPNAGAQLRADLTLLPDLFPSSNSSLGEAQMHDPCVSSSLPTNSVSSSAGDLQLAGENSDQNDGHMSLHGPHLMCPPCGNSTGLEGDPPGAYARVGGGESAPGSASDSVVAAHQKSR